MSKKIPLYREGEIIAHALVDEDFQSECKWYLRRDGHAFCHQRQDGKNFTLQMSRQILGLKKGDTRLAEHINSDKLDNRRENLRAVEFPEEIRPESEQERQEREQRLREGQQRQQEWERRKLEKARQREEDKRKLVQRMLKHGIGREQFRKKLGGNRKKIDSALDKLIAKGYVNERVVDGERFIRWAVVEEESD